jgi:hypothetical protein
MPKHKAPMKVEQERFVRMEARGASRQELLREFFGIDDIHTADPKKVNASDQQMWRWRQHPDYDVVWKDEVRKMLYGATGEALKVIRSQLRDEKQPWLANKAANDFLNYGKSQIFGDEERTVNVQISGLPDLGEPDPDDA